MSYALKLIANTFKQTNEEEWDHTKEAMPNCFTFTKYGHCSKQESGQCRRAHWDRDARQIIAIEGAMPCDGTSLSALIFETCTLSHQSAVPLEK